MKFMELGLAGASLRSRGSEELLHRFDIRCSTVRRQAVEKHVPVLLLEDTVVQQAEQATVAERANQPAKPLLQRDHGTRDLVLEEGIAAIFVYRLDSRGHHGIVRHGKRQLVDDDATQLLALHVNSLPEGRRRKQYGVWRQPKLLQQRILGCAALKQHGVFQLAQQPLVKLIHQRMAGEQAEGATARDVQ